MKKTLPTSEVLLVAIRAHCLACSGGSRREVERCKIRECNLHPYRNTKAIGGEHERQTRIKGQLDLFDVLMATKEENAG